MSQPMRFLLALIACCSLASATFAQGVTVEGTIVEASDQSPLISVNVILTSKADSTKFKGTVTGLRGEFYFGGMTPGTYVLRATYIGYKTLEMQIEVSGQSKVLGNLPMEVEATVLQGVTVEGQAVRVEQIGDTTQFNAGAYKVNKDATIEDLVTKMPGITVENGTVKARGENVQKVTVDGRDFFGDDATLALRNMPAEIVDKIQVFDRLSDQAQFTGFDDGNSVRTLNIVTRNGRSNGQFGKIYAGYGTDDRYIGGGNVNLFKGDRRVSIIGMANNINQQNFATEDLLGVTGQQSRGGGGRGGFSGGGRGGPGGGGGFRGGGNVNDFLVGQQNGITATQALGLNYSDNWGQKIKVSGSYFFNRSANDNSSDLSRSYFSDEGLSQQYFENSNNESTNFNHRLNARLEYSIDSSNTIILTPRISFQNNDYYSLNSGFNTLSNGDLLSETQNNRSSENKGYSFSNSLLYRHRFSKQGRTISLNFRTDLNDRNGNTGLYAINTYYDIMDTTQLIDQRSDPTSNGRTLAASLNYTEPIGKTGQLQLTYNPSQTKSDAEKSTFSRDIITGDYSLQDTALSNVYTNTYTTQRGGVSYRLRGEKWNFSVGVDFQDAQLKGDQTFPYSEEVNRSFTNWLPNAMYNYRFSRTSNLRIMYRSNTNAPSISQLQEVIDNSNPLLLSTGNPDLRQSYGQTLIIRYGKSNPENARSFYAFIYGGITNDNIANATILASRDTLLASGVVLNKGSQLTLPVNIDGYWNLRSFLTYGLPVSWLKSNLNLNAGISYSLAPGLINGEQNEAETYNYSGGLVLSSNISEKIDFTLSYTANYNVVNNSIQPQLDNNYYYHNAGARLNWIFAKSFVFNTSIDQTFYSGLTDGFNQDYWLWNAGVGYKFLKNQAGELKFSAFDILNNNNSVARTVTETYIEDTTSQVLRRYYLLTFTYTMRNFNAGK